MRYLNQKNKPFYRPELDGLRAIAVLAVLLYHLGFSSTGGGFIGVDVFFVISGFLISNIIITRPLTNEEIEYHNFITRNPVLNIRNLLFYYRLLKDNRFLFGARGDLIGSEESSLKKSINMEQQMKKVFPTPTLVSYWAMFSLGLKSLTKKYEPLRKKQMSHLM